MEMRNFLKRIPFFIATLMISLAMFLAAFLPQKSISVSAERADVPYMTSSIEDDLSDLSELRYPANEWADHELVRFTEFFYTEDKNEEYRYGLYVYVYNPVEKEISRANASVNMAITYNEKGEPEEYANFALQYVDHTSNHRFYKYYVKDSSRLLNTARAYEQANGKRRYDVAGVQIMYKSGVDVKDEKVGLTYFFSGYGKGLGSGAEKQSTLTCESRMLETIELEVNSTYDRFLTWESSNYYDYDQVSMVYFSVPEEYFTNYGGLQKIKSEWYEYKTKPIFVTSDEGNYDDLYPWLHTNIGNGTKDCHCTVMWDDFRYSGISGYTCNFVYNGSASYWGDNNPHKLSQMDWLFYRADVEDDEDYYVTTDEILDYMRWYTNRFGGELVTDRYSKALFENSIDKGRLDLLKDPTSTCGYVVQEIDAGDTINLVEVEDQTIWESIWSERESTSYEIDPIVVIDAEDMNGLNANTFAHTYHINEHDAAVVYEAAVDATRKGERFVLFSFAVTEYVTMEACFDDNTSGGISSYDGFIAQETVFLNYDVISLTFRSELGVDTVIAAVANPIDIVSGIEAPSGLADDGCGDIWSVIYMILGLVVVVLIIIFWPYVGPIITAPFRFIAYLIRRCRERSADKRMRRVEKLHAKAEKEKQKAAIERDKAALAKAKQARKAAKKNKKYKITYKGDKK